MLDALVFFNNCNKGDVHVSRELVKHLIRLVPAKSYLYSHRWSPRLILDLPVAQGGFRHPKTGMPVFRRDQPFFHDPHNNLLALNTWYGANPTAPGGVQCTLNVLVGLFEHHIKRHSIRGALPMIDQLIPRIDYSKYQIAGAREFLQRSAAWRKRVMVCDGPVLSGQTGGSLEDFRAAVLAAVAANPDVLFFMTERGDWNFSNVVYTADVIGLPKDEVDLCECSYISTKCDVVIGRASGPYTFAYVADNFLDPKKTMLCFTDGESTAQWVYPREVTRARMMWSNDYGRESMRLKIEEALA